MCRADRRPRLVVRVLQLRRIQLGQRVAAAHLLAHGNLRRIGSKQLQFDLPHLQRIREQTRVQIRRVDERHVRLDGRLGDEQTGRGPAVGLALGDERQDLAGQHDAPDHHVGDGDTERCGESDHERRAAVEPSTGAAEPRWPSSSSCDSR